jgi:hypothetical protein
MNGLISKLKEIKVGPATFALILAIVAAFVIGIPLAVIWSMNTLFPVLAIPYSIETWLAAFIMYGILNTKKTKD